MKKRFLPLIIIASLFATTGVAQQSMLYNHYYLNPFLYNPSYIAPTGYTELYLNYRKQWVGIDGAPTTSTLNFQVPLNYKSGLAFTAIQDEAGILKTTTGLISFSYSVYFGTRITDVNKLSFGLSAGVTNSRLDPDQADDINDPVLGNNTTSLDGQFGLHYRYNRFKIGFAIPRIFETQVVDEESFSKAGISQLNNTISSISYDFKISDRFSFEPMATYRTYQNLDPFFEAIATFKIADVAWVGGGYRQNYGAFPFLGVNVKQKLRVAYSYEIATNQTDKMGSGSHEVQLAWRIGKKQHARQSTLVEKTAPAPQEQVQPQATNVTPPAENTIEPVATTPKPIADQIVPATIVVTGKDNVTPQNNVTQKNVQQSTVTQQKDPAAVVNNQPKPITNLKGEGLAPGHYVVVGIFNSGQNALTYMGMLKRAGYPAIVAFDPSKNRYVVHMEQPSEDIEHARQMRDKYRQMSRYSFRDTWILTIE
jgi:type IX secretion system PorP/SprF family membrane protein